MDTIGSLIDKLIVTNCRIWVAEDAKRVKGATDLEIATATKITNVANKLRNDLIQEIDERLNDIGMGELQKLYKQGDTKIYGK